MTQPTRASVQGALRQAQNCFNQGNFSAAEPIYKQMVEAIPPESEEYALCLHNLGEINEQRGNLTTAIWWQSRLLQHDLMQQDGMVNHLYSRMGHIAALYTKAGRPSEANQLYHQMVAVKSRLHPGAPEGFQPQSEIGTFLRGVLDNTHKKHSTDAEETLQTNQALTRLQEAAAAGLPPAPPQSLPGRDLPTQSLQTGADFSASQTIQFAQGGQQFVGATPPPGFGAPPSVSPGQPSQAVTGKTFNPGELESIASPKTSASRGYQELDQPDSSAASRIGRGRRVGIGEVEEAPTEMDSKLEGLSNAWTAIINNPLAPMGFLAGLCLGLFILFHLPYQGNPDAQFKKMPHNYSTVDGLRTLEINGTNECSVVMDKQKVPFQSKFYFGDLREAVFLALGQLPEKQYWLTDRKTAFVDDKGSTYYVTFGPEPKLGRAMGVISDAVSVFYNSHNLKYPTSVEDMGGGVELQYQNPYNDKIEVADIQSVTVEKSARGDTARGDFYEQLALGKGWQNERPLTPGAINCAAVQINGPRGPIQAFVIQAGDAEGKPIVGSNGLSYYKALEDGKPQEMVSSTTPFFTDGTMRKKLIVFCERPIDSTLGFMIHNAACWLFTILAFLSGCVFLSLPKRSGSKVVAMALVVIFGILASVYTISGRL